MGNYQNPPNNPPINVNWKRDEFESTYVQRIKETPFSYSQLYKLNPPIFIDPVGSNLSKLLQPRLSTEQFFPPEEVIKIMDSAISALIELQENGFDAHGDISADTIYYDKRKKIFKVTHPVFSPKSGLQLTEQGLRFSFLSPQQLLILTEQNEVENNTSKKVSFKSDLFTLGILMCQVCTLKSSSDIYCPQTYNIFDLQIKNRLDLVGQFYGGHENAHNYKIMISMLEEMLEYDEINRKSPRQLKNLLETLRKQEIQPVRNPPFIDPNQNSRVNLPNPHYNQPY